MSSGSFPTPSRMPSGHLSLVALLVGLTSSFHFGIQLTATNPSHQTFLQFINKSIQSRHGRTMGRKGLEAIWSVIVSLLFLGAIFSSLLLRPLADHLGRLRALLLGNLFSSLCLALCASSYFLNSFELFALARLGIGFSLSLCLGFAGIFLAECSPKRCRGSVSMTTGVLLQLGTVCGSSLAIPGLLGSPHNWWILFAAEGAQLLATNVLLAMIARESPGFILLHHNDDLRARQSVLFYHNCPPEQLHQKMDELQGDLRHSARHHSMGLCELARQRGVNRKGAIIGSIVALAMAFSGIAVINAFAVELFRATGLSARWASLANVGLSVLSLVANLASAILIDRFGRRWLLLSTLSLIFVLNIAIGALMTAYEWTQFKWLGLCLIGAISLFSAAFAFGPGPMCYFLPAELVQHNARSAAQGWATLSQMASRGILLSSFLPLRNAIGAGFAYSALFVLPVLASILILFRHLPETKNRDMLEVHSEMHNLPKLSLGMREKVAINRVVQNKSAGWTNIVVNDDEKKYEDWRIHYF